MRDICQGMWVNNHEICEICYSCKHSNICSSIVNKIPPADATSKECSEYIPKDNSQTNLAENLKPFVAVRHVKTGRVETVLMPSVKMKDSQNGWVEAVVYQGIDCETGEPMVFCKNKEDFIVEFTLHRTY